MCPREHSTIRSNGVLHPDDDYLARALTVPLHRVSRCRLPAVWQLRSWLEAEGELHSTTMSSPTVTGPGRWVATTVRMSTDARDARIGSLYRAVCMHPGMAPCRTGWPGLPSVYSPSCVWVPYVVDHCNSTRSNVLHHCRTSPACLADSGSLRASRRVGNTRTLRFETSSNNLNYRYIP